MRSLNPSSALRSDLLENNPEPSRLLIGSRLAAPNRQQPDIAPLEPHGNEPAVTKSDAKSKKITKPAVDAAMIKIKQLSLAIEQQKAATQKSTSNTKAEAQIIAAVARKEEAALRVEESKYRVQQLKLSLKVCQILKDVGVFKTPLHEDDIDSNEMYIEGSSPRYLDILWFTEADLHLGDNDDDDYDMNESD
ncbi:hypothetical protein Hypma_000480 [Hypsizygus marmoreus]|uniref:Uncharacterized protein n=1 Tax=Hypsizygus marmoreus TaxID=39966 RepID=A0A369JC38_HYPMA|nr:hypothetical protein Hypma_000480 [Hypsizygus marmoreus]